MAVQDVFPKYFFMANVDGAVRQEIAGGQRERLGRADSASFPEGSRIRMNGKRQFFTTLAFDVCQAKTAFAKNFVRDVQSYCDRAPVRSPGLRWTRFDALQANGLAFP